MSNFILLVSIVVAMVIISFGLFYAEDGPPDPNKRVRQAEEKAMKKIVQNQKKANSGRSSNSDASFELLRTGILPAATKAKKPSVSLLSSSSSSPVRSSDPSSSPSEATTTVATASAGDASWILSPIVVGQNGNKQAAVAAKKRRRRTVAPGGSDKEGERLKRALLESTAPADRAKLLERLDLVGSIGGRPLEPIDTFIGLGGKRLRHIKLLGNSADFEAEQKHTRSVWFDLGARVWPKGSTMWFARNYPRSGSFEAELYDVLDLRHTYPREPPFKAFAFHSKAAWIREGTVTIGGVKMGHVKHDNEELDNSRVTVWKTRSVDFAQVLLKNYSTPTDFVVVKMDVEGGEWPLLQHLEKTGALEHIDEMMLECHPPPPDYATSDKKLALRRGEMHPDCIRLINRMRLSGVFCHGWF